MLSPNIQFRVIALLCILGFALVSGVVVAQNQGERVTSTEFSGPGKVVVDENPEGNLYLWRSEQFSYTATIDGGNISGDQRVCLAARSTNGGNATQLDCQVTTFNDSEPTVVHFDSVSAPKNASGEYYVDFSLDSPSSPENDTILNNSATVWFITKGGDLDGDGLTNKREVNRYRTNLYQKDTDKDGLDDFEEADTYHTDPTLVDTDRDGIRDGVEVNLGMNPNSPVVPYLLAAVALAGGALAVVRYRTRVRTPDGVDSDPNGADGVHRHPNGPVDPDGSATDSNGGMAPPEPSSTVPDEPLTDEDRILRLLAEHDGRLMQGDIVERTDWSKSKVSRRLSTLEEEGEITKISLGRENLVALPGHEPEGARSPFDEPIEDGDVSVDLDSASEAATVDDTAADEPSDADAGATSTDATDTDDAADESDVERDPDDQSR